MLFVSHKIGRCARSSTELGAVFFLL